MQGVWVVESFIGNGERMPERPADLSGKGPGVAVWILKRKAP